MINQEGFLTIANVRPDRLADLEALLRDANLHARDPRLPAIVPFQACASIHFCRFVLLHPAKDARGGDIAPTLVFSTNYDEPLDAHLTEVSEKWLDGLRSIYAHCEDFPPDASPQQIVAYFKQHSKPYAAFYVGTLGRTVSQIRDEARLRDEINAFLDRGQHEGANWAALPHRAIRERIQHFVSSRPDLAWALISPSGRDPVWYVGRYGPLVLLIVLAAVVLLGLLAAGLLGGLLLLVSAAVAWWVVTLHRNEEFDRRPENIVDYTNNALDKPKIKRLVEAEDRVVQNQFTSVNLVKPQHLRLFTLRVVLWLINFTARYIFNNGHLSNIRSIHFARWVLVDDNRRLAFFSNFDGSWENYLGDFVDRASTGLTAIWSNTKDFPPARRLIEEGAKNEQPFKAVARHYQTHTDVWYSAYPQLTTTNILNNTEIRRGLSGDLADDKVRDWLKRL